MSEAIKRASVPIETLRAEGRTCIEAFREKRIRLVAALPEINPRPPAPPREDGPKT